MQTSLPFCDVGEGNEVMDEGGMGKGTESQRLGAGEEEIRGNESSMQL
jgi:hypothetical protein